VDAFLVRAVWCRSTSSTQGCPLRIRIQAHAQSLTAPVCSPLIRAAPHAYTPLAHRSVILLRLLTAPVSAPLSRIAPACSPAPAGSPDLRCDPTAHAQSRRSRVLTDPVCSPRSRAALHAHSLLLAHRSVMLLRMPLPLRCAGPHPLPLAHAQSRCCVCSPDPIRAPLSRTGFRSPSRGFFAFAPSAASRLPPVFCSGAL
jgi:hypothetical protein